MAVYTAVLSGTISDSDEFEFLSGVLDDVGATAVPPADSPFESNGGGAAILAEAFNTSMYDMDANSRTPTLRIWFDGQWDILIEAAGALQIALTVSACNAEGVASGPARHWSANGGYDYDPDGGVKFMSEAEAFASLSDVRLHASVELAEDLESFDLAPPINTAMLDDKKIIHEHNYYNIIFYNDEVTPRLFVIFLLVEDFNMGIGQAECLVREIEELGECIAVTATYDTATKLQAVAMAKVASRGFPLRIVVSKA